MFARLAQQMNRARARAGAGGGGGSGGGRGGPSPQGLLTGSGLIIVLGVGAVAVNSALYNVDGGHRAIMYSRLHGVLKNIYPEGTHFRVSFAEEDSLLTLQDPMD